jgi:hypothetical protein
MLKDINSDIDKKEKKNNISSGSDNSDNTYNSDNEADKNDKSKYDFNMNTFFKSKREMIIYKMVKDFFIKNCTRKTIEKVVNIIEKNSDISLRILDWFVTKYTKKKINIIIDNKEDKDVKEFKEFDVHISYKGQLKSFKKKIFDPFKRKEPCKFNFAWDPEDPTKKVTTTLAQLNFFKWSITNKIIDYVETNLIQIIKAMNQSNKDDRKKKTDKKVKRENKEKEESIKINVSKKENSVDDEVEITLTFD